MTAKKEALKVLCDSIYGLEISQILIDLVQEKVEPLLQKIELPTSEQVGAVSYRVDILHEVFNPLLDPDYKFITALLKAVDELSAEMDANDKILIF